MQRFFIISGILAVLALYALTLSTDSNSQLSSSFWAIVAFCILLILCMFVVIIRYILLIIRDKHNRVFGSQIARRLSLMFTLVAVLPALFLLGVSAQFISHNIRSWFGNDTKEAIERSLKLSQSALEAAVTKAAEQANIVRNNLVLTSLEQNDLSPAFNTQQARRFNQLVVWDLQNASVIQQINPQQLRQPDIDETTLKSLLHQGTVRGIENLNNKLYARGWLKLPDTEGRHYALFFRQAIPENVAKDAELIEAARSKYAELMFAQKGMQTFFLITLIVAATLAILLALAIALYFAHRFVEPILQLASGARAVAQGNFKQRIVVKQKDELGKLANLFNHMSEQLAIAKQADEQHRIEQEAIRHYLERVLDSLSTGVITLSSTGALNTFNHSAQSILDMPLASLIGRNHLDWKHQSPSHMILAETFVALLATEKSGQVAEITYTGADESRILLGKAIRLPAENGEGVVLVFDNITTLVLAQKEAAWGEVAKRLAHEIRNPLTPIQLSAERLAWKLHSKLNENDAQILTKSTDTIIKQVAALKEMVEAFRNYARAPALKLDIIDLNKLIAEVLVLYESNPCTFHAEFSKIPMLLKADTTAMRQILHNLFKNAVEAAESALKPEVWVRTDREEGQIVLTVSNNGKSFSKSMLQNAFEPYITDKATGTGLGLSVVKKIVDEHGGKISLTNLDDEGACITLRFILENNNLCEVPTS